MISEELVASSRTQVHEADSPEKPPEAGAAHKPRVSAAPRALRLAQPLLPGEAAGDQGDLGMGPGSTPGPDSLPRRPWASLGLLHPQ